MVAVGLEHLSADNNGGGSSKASKPNGEFGVTLPDAQSTFGLPANGDVTGRSKFIAKELHGRLSCDAIG
jgi:hypothetical protein